jgi:hypothetical protein
MKTPKTQDEVREMNQARNKRRKERRKFQNAYEIADKLTKRPANRKKDVDSRRVRPENYPFIIPMYHPTIEQQVAEKERKKQIKLMREQKNIPSEFEEEMIDDEEENEAVIEEVDIHEDSVSDQDQTEGTEEIAE